MADHDSRFRPPFAKTIAPVPATSLIGREQATAELVSLLIDGAPRLVTLTGPGGIGKTRVALEAASIVQARGESDVLFVPLASILDPELVAPAIGRAVGLDATDTQTLPDRLAVALDERRLLLVLDNLEQILPAAPLVSNLSSCPMLSVLVSSRTPLHLSAEYEIQVAPLGLPESGSPDDWFVLAPAVQLFIERASLVESDLTFEELGSIAEICRRLDGLPLAIELAAANTRIMSPADLVSRMDRILPLLTGGPRDAPARLQTMRNAIAWSYDLLSGDEQTLFRTLSVFQGGFTLADAEAVAPASLTAPVYSLFHALVDSSLVLRTGARSDAARFTMLETVKEFGKETLVARGEEAAARDRHLEWYVDRVAAERSGSWFDPHGIMTVVFPGEQDNLRAALNWALEREKSKEAGQIAFGLLPYWRRNGFFAEIASTLDRIGDQCKETDPLLFAAVTNMSAQFLWYLGEFSRSREHAISTLEVCRHIGDPVCIRAGLRTLGWLTIFSDGASAFALLTEAIEISRGLSDTWHYALDLRHRAFSSVVLGNIQRAKRDLAEALPLLKEIPDSGPQLVFAMQLLAYIAALEQDYDLAEQRGQETLDLASEFELVECQSFCHRILGEVALARKAHQTALDHFQEALRLVYRSGLQSQEGYCFLDLAVLAQRQHDFERSAQLFGAANANWTRLGISSKDSGTAMCAVQFSPFEENQDGEHYESNFLAGQQLSRREAYTLGMSMTIAPSLQQTQSSLLTGRQHEVLQLLASGCTNREIADALFVSKRTADFHVTSILAKLNVDSRRAAVTAAREQGLLSSPEVSSPSHPGITI